MFQSVNTTIISEGIIDSVIDHTISISKYNPLAENSYVKLAKELDHPRKGLINVQNINDNECFKWSKVRYLNPADFTQQELQKLKKNFLKNLVLKT